jgi:hypothetical protein
MTSIVEARDTSSWVLIGKSDDQTSIGTAGEVDPKTNIVDILTIYNFKNPKLKDKKQYLSEQWLYVFHCKEKWILPITRILTSQHDGNGAVIYSHTGHFTDKLPTGPANPIARKVALPACERSKR